MTRGIRDPETYYYRRVFTDAVRAVDFLRARPQIVRYLRAHRGDAQAVARTLSYVDGVSFAARARGAGLFSVALHDVVCPPSTVFAAFNAFAGQAKEMVVWPFNGHEGGGADQWSLQVEFLSRVW